MKLLKLLDPCRYDDFPSKRLVIHLFDNNTPFDNTKILHVTYLVYSLAGNQPFLVDICCLELAYSLAEIQLSPVGTCCLELAYSLAENQSSPVGICCLELACSLEVHQLFLLGICCLELACSLAGIQLFPVGICCLESAGRISLCKPRCHLSNGNHCSPLSLLLRERMSP